MLDVFLLQAVKAYPFLFGSPFLFARGVLRLICCCNTANTILYCNTTVTYGPSLVPGKDSHNNTILTLERSLQAAGTDGYADEKSGTSPECVVRVPKGVRD